MLFLMPGETNLNILLKSMQPKLNAGEYVFCTIKDAAQIQFSDVVMLFKEAEGLTLILDKEVADQLQLSYSFIASWIMLTIHSSLEAVGLTAAFSRALADENISCNIVAGYFHDHIFVGKNDAERAMSVLSKLSETSLNYKNVSR
jgi:hypothetical protein